MKSIAEVQKSSKDRVESLQKTASEKVKTLQCHSKLAREQVSKVEDDLEKKEAEIEQVYTEAVKHLTKNKHELLKKYDSCKQNITKCLKNTIESTNNEIKIINSLSDLVGNGARIVLEGDNVTTHESLCNDLGVILKKGGAKISECLDISKQTDNLRFIKDSEGKELELGHLIGDWCLGKCDKVKVSGKEVWHMYPLPTGGVAVGGDWGIDIFHADWSKTTVLKGSEIYRVSTLSDGRFIVRKDGTDLVLYKQNWETLTTQFKTKDNARGGGFCTDRYSNIYVGNALNEHIDVFRPEGGAPIKVIPCHDYQPFYILPMNDENLLLVRDITEVRIIDMVGSVLEIVRKDDSWACPAVLKDDSIIIGWLKGDWLTVDLYTPQLKFVKTVLGNFEIRRPNIVSHVFFVEMSNGDIVFNDEDSLYVFKKSNI